jgi:uncharacterized protein
MSGAFPCSRCGACCRSVRLSELKAPLDRGDGVCRHLDEIQNTCTIYESRPDICNIQRSYEKHYIPSVSWPDFVALNQLACEELLNQVLVGSKINS